MPSLITGPSLWSAVANVAAFRRDPLSLMDRMAVQYGPVVKVPFAWLTRYLVNDPAMARQILQLPHTAANKDTRSVRLLRYCAAESVLTANGESWFHRRRLVQPAFHHRRMEALPSLMAELCGQMLERWRTQPHIEAHDEMTRLTFTLICRVLFADAPVSAAADMQSPVTLVLATLWKAVLSPLQTPLWSLTRSRRRFDAALAGIDAFIHDQIRRRRESGGDGHGDLLQMLLDSRDADTGEAMSDEQVRNECITMLIAGHETTANALTWALLLLAEHPHELSLLREEVNSVLGERSPGLEDLARLPRTRAVFMEAMRLYPPIWLMERNLDVPMDSSGISLPAGAQLLISPWVLHRLPEYWIEPERFNPSRFLTPGAEDNPAFLPFGTGPRVCIGRHLAIWEGIVFLAMIVRRASLERVDQVRVPVEPGISLRPGREIILRV